MMMPSHRDDIFSFLENFNVQKSATSTRFQSAVVAPEHSQDSTSADSGKVTKEGIGLERINCKPLLAQEEIRYLKQYGRELYDDMVESQYKS